MGSVRRNAHRLKRLVDDMLDVSRIEDGTDGAAPRAGRPRRHRATTWSPSCCRSRNARDQTVEAKIETVDEIDADRDKLHQIAVNLVSNAIRYTPESGEISISVDEAPRDRYPGGWARLRVRDNGVGIAEEDRQRIFDPFLHAEPVQHHTSALPDSAGLGLYIARGLIELHGGLITVDSAARGVHRVHGPAAVQARAADRATDRARAQRSLSLRLTTTRRRGRRARGHRPRGRASETRRSRRTRARRACGTRTHGW